MDFPSDLAFLIRAETLSLLSLLVIDFDVVASNLNNTILHWWMQKSLPEDQLRWGLCAQAK